MLINGWGRYPVIDAKLHTPLIYNDIAEILKNNSQIIPRGMGRSYGDSALSGSVINMNYLDHVLAFDQESGIVRCQAGVTLENILDIFVPKGWFLSVTPGTKYVTVGGAVASDVHGKNHHIDGCFSECVKSLTVMLASGDLMTCSSTENSDLFKATCGGMGLTGVIVEVEMYLKPVKSSLIHETIFKTKNLNETLDLFDEYNGSTYSVAWIDCLSTGNDLGRSLLMLGEHSEEGGLILQGKSAITIPVEMPSMLLNSYTIKLFNALYYNRIRKYKVEHDVHYEPFFYPLDRIKQWNRMYGKNGFVQYQFVLPKTSGRKGMMEILSKIADSRRGSFLAVLKVFGKGNSNYLSFPVEGYTLALDFKMDSGVLSFLDELDKIVIEYGGKIYLTKDSRMSQDTFKNSYTEWDKFQQSRIKYGADQMFSSLQSKRLGI